MLSPEEIGSPRRAGSFRLKSFEGSGKPEASLGELGSRKLRKKILSPLLDPHIRGSLVLWAGF